MTRKNLLIMLGLLSLNFSFAQKREIKQTVKFNAVTVFSGVYDIQYEKVLDSKNSVQFGIGFGNHDSSDAAKARKILRDNFTTYGTPDNVLMNEKTFTLNADYRHYYMKTTSAPRGLYISPSIEYLKSDNSLTVFNDDGTSNEYTQKLNLVNLRFLVGCQLAIAKYVCFNPYFGPSYAIGTAKAYSGADDTKAKGLLLNYGIYLGIAL